MQEWGIWTGKEKQRALQENGGLLLQERIATCYGKDNPIRIFSAGQLDEAIGKFKKNFPQQTYPRRDYCYQWQKGILDDRLVMIKQYIPKKVRYNGSPYRNIAVSSMMSSHSNVLKLLGCCLELKVPALVYEYAEKGSLNPRGGRDDGGTLPWTTRVKIAKQIASVVTYMHTAFPRPIIHRNIKPTNILLDQNCNAKLSDFSLSIPIPEGKSRIEDDKVAGTMGFIDPSYMGTLKITEKTDVYSFGVLLLVLLTGVRPDPISSDHFETEPNIVQEIIDTENSDKVKVEPFRKGVVDPVVLEEVAASETEERQLQLQAFVEVALRCIKKNPDDRPEMIEVAKELVRIDKLVVSASSKLQSNQIDCAVATKIPPLSPIRKGGRRDFVSIILRTSLFLFLLCLLHYTCLVLQI